MCEMTELWKAKWVVFIDKESWRVRPWDIGLSWFDVVLMLNCFIMNDSESESKI